MCKLRGSTLAAALNELCYKCASCVVHAVLLLTPDAVWSLCGQYMSTTAEACYVCELLCAQNVGVRALVRSEAKEYCITYAL